MLYNARCNFSCCNVLACGTHSVRCGVERIEHAQRAHCFRRLALMRLLRSQPSVPLVFAEHCRCRC